MKCMEMKQTDFARHLTDFIGKHLSVECGVAANTIKTYGFTFMLLLQFYNEQLFIKPDHLTLSEITKKRVIGFLDWLEKDRNCSPSTRNNRLAAIHSFFNYLQYRNVEGMSKWQEILSIKRKKSTTPEMSYLTIDGIRLLLRQPDLTTRIGRRDFALLGLLYDSGCRVQELIDLTPASIREDSTVTVRLVGKGRKVRIVPLSRTEASNLLTYMKERGLDRTESISEPLFSNPQGNKLSRMSVLNIVKKYVRMAREKNPDLIPEDIGCHSFRHSKAMHMLEADINLVYIRDFLGHSSTTTTEVYARASEKMKKDALQKLDKTIVREGKSSWQKDKALLAYLKNLQNKY